MALFSSGFTEVIQVLSQEASRGFTLFRMKNICISVILCFSLSESDNANFNTNFLSSLLCNSADLQTEH